MRFDNKAYCILVLVFIIDELQTEFVVPVAVFHADFHLVADPQCRANVIGDLRVEMELGV